MQQLVIIRGPQGCGKSIKARRDFSSYRHFEQGEMKHIDYALLTGTSVVVTGEFPDYKSLKPYCKLAILHEVENFLVITMPILEPRP